MVGQRIIHPMVGQRMTVRYTREQRVPRSKASYAHAAASDDIGRAKAAAIFQAVVQPVTKSGVWGSMHRLRLLHGYYTVRRPTQGHLARGRQRPRGAEPRPRAPLRGRV